MTWEQKLQALDALAGPARIAMREPGNWFVSHRLEIKDRGLLRGGCGNGKSVEEAVEDQWGRLTDKLASHEYIVVSPPDLPRRALRWNGFMWADVDEKQQAA